MDDPTGMERRVDGLYGPWYIPVVLMMQNICTHAYVIICLYSIKNIHRRTPKVVVSHLWDPFRHAHIPTVFCPRWVPCLWSCFLVAGCKISKEASKDSRHHRCGGSWCGHSTAGPCAEFRLSLECKAVYSQAGDMGHGRRRLVIFGEDLRIRIILQLKWIIQNLWISSVYIKIYDDTICSFVR